MAERELLASGRASIIREPTYGGQLQELGVKVTVAEEQKITLFDGSFDGKDPDRYAKSFPINSLAG